MIKDGKYGLLLDQAGRRNTYQVRSMFLEMNLRRNVFYVVPGLHFIDVVSFVTKFYH
jgi:hypothetical protein